jgi:hypothetical protein
MNWPLYFKNHKNKFFAVFFSALGIACFVGVAIMFFLQSTGDFGSQSYIIALINIVFELGLMIYLLSCNINNDNRAYMAIMMWIFWFFLEQFEDVVYGSAGLFSVLGSGDALLIGMSMAYLAFGIACFAVGLTLYLLVRRYMIGLDNNYRRIRILAIVYASLSGVALAFNLAITFISLGVAGWAMVLVALLTPIAELLIDVAIIFTLERLRRTY